MSIADFHAFMRAEHTSLEAQALAWVQTQAFWQWNSALHDALKEHRVVCWLYHLTPTFDSITGV